MKITKEMVVEAIKTGHDMCPATGCIHAEAFAENMELVFQQAEEASLVGARKGSPALAAYFEGMHVGFRLALISMQEELKDENPSS